MNKEKTIDKHSTLIGLSSLLSITNRNVEALIPRCIYRIHNLPLSSYIENAGLLKNHLSYYVVAMEYIDWREIFSNYLTSRLDSSNNERLRANIKLLTEYWKIEVFNGDV